MGSWIRLRRWPRRRRKLERGLKPRSNPLVHCCCHITLPVCHRFSNLVPLMNTSKRDNYNSCMHMPCHLNTTPRLKQKHPSIHSHPLIAPVDKQRPHLQDASQPYLHSRTAHALLPMQLGFFDIGLVLDTQLVISVKSDLLFVVSGTCRRRSRSQSRSRRERGRGGRKRSGRRDRSGRRHRRRQRLRNLL